MTVRTGTIRRTIGTSFHGEPAHGTFIDDQATIGAIIGAMPSIPVRLDAILIGGCGMWPPMIGNLSRTFRFAVANETVEAVVFKNKNL